MTSFWHPFAEMSKAQHNPFIVDRGEGIYVYDETGKRYLDAAASLWYMNVGYGREEIVDAMAEQMRKLPVFHAFVDYATRPPMELAAQIAAVSPDPDSKVFFGSGGSDAVDTAAKLARRYFGVIGQPERTVFIAREWAYHGMHSYGTALGGMEPNRLGYGGELVSDVVLVPYDDSEAVEKAIDHAGADRVAGIFVEAVIGAGGIRPVSPEYLSSVRETIRAAGALYISDEVITGFGRVGDWFAANLYGLEPDLITFAKGVTCGYAPLGGVVVAPHIAEPFFNTPGLVFRHGYTYSGHTAACAAGLTVMDIIQREGLIQRAKDLEDEIYNALLPLEELEVVAKIRRGVGALAAIQLEVGDDETMPYRAAEVCRSAGVLTRAVGGGGLQVSPPLIMTSDQVDEMASLFGAGLRSL
ncbi:MAG: aspartate aminotransferase family protein [Acidobacteria bacterium]|nr:aspartate aminotransferase family protein [Acidobacteriota bacterium]MCZ6739137.1 aminotransferase class III-fold pyridoxal phosphate-dependent enzyme [Actinomycetota bacterium]